KYFRPPIISTWFLLHLSMAKDDLVLLHFSLGKDIRNAFGLNGDNAVLLGKRCADDVSGDIIEALWEKLSN
ncbi:MAG: DUF6794 domain-containing protein, partial [Methyloprofundus sp.]